MNHFLDGVDKPLTIITLNMDIKYLIIIAILPLCCVLRTDSELNKNNQRVRTTISVYLTPQHGIILNYSSNYSTNINFINKTSKDSIIKREVFIDKPTLFFAIENLPTFKYKSLLICPGDSIVLNDNGNTIRHSPSFLNYIDSIINIPQLFYISSPTTERAFNKKGLSEILQYSEKIFEDNNSRIKDSHLTKELEGVIKSMNYIVKYKMLSYIDIGTVSTGKYQVLDSITKDILLNMAKVEAINDGFQQSIYKFIIQSSYYLKYKKPMKDFWIDINYVDKSVWTAPYYFQYFVEWIHFYCIFYFFFNDTATTEIYTLSLHDALPISRPSRA